MHTHIPYSGLLSWVEIFVKSWKRLPELNFVVLNFVARWSIPDDVMNFELIGMTESNRRCGTEWRDYPSADSF